MQPNSQLLNVKDYTRKNKVWHTMSGHINNLNAKRFQLSVYLEKCYRFIFPSSYEQKTKKLYTLYGGKRIEV